MSYGDFIEVIPSEGITPPGFWLVIEGRTPNSEEIIDDCYDTPEQAKAAHREIKAEIERGSLDRSEAAIHAGMAFGIDAYNDHMGYA